MRSINSTRNSTSTRKSNRKSSNRKRSIRKDYKSKTMKILKGGSLNSGLKPGLKPGLRLPLNPELRLPLKFTIPERFSAKQIIKFRNIKMTTNWRNNPDFKVAFVEKTNSFLNVLEINVKSTLLTNYEIQYVDLNVDTLQYAINNGYISSVPSNGETFLTFDKEFPVLIMDRKPVALNDLGGGSNKTGSNNMFIDVYEGGDVLTQTEITDIEKTNIENYNKSRYENEVKKLDNNSIGTIQENIAYVLKIGEYLSNKELGITVENEKECELDFLNEYVIQEDMYGYTIIGYPDPKTMSHYIHLLKKEKLEEDTKLKEDTKLNLTQNKKIRLSDIHDDHKNNFSEYMAKLYNFFHETETEKIQDIKEEIYKMFWRTFDFDKIISFYKNIKTNEQSLPVEFPEFSEFETKFTNMFQNLNNEIANTYLNKPNIRIKYNFFIFKKDNKDVENKYIPAIFNVRDLKPEHNKILKRIEELIQTEIPKKFNIFENPMKNSTNDGGNTQASAQESAQESAQASANSSDKYNPKAYKLFYSYVKLGSIFHIKAEYLHTMSNLLNFANLYKNSILLSELIYMLSLDKNLNTLRLNYSVKNNTLKIEKIDNKKENSIDFDFYISKPTYEIVDKCTPEYFRKKQESLKKNQTSIKESVSKLPLTTFIKGSTILFVYKGIGGSYTFIYMNGNEFYIITFEPNLCDISEEIINLPIFETSVQTPAQNQSPLSENKIFSCEYQNILGHFIKFNLETKTLIPQVSGLPLFKVVSHRIFNNTDYLGLSMYNPILLHNIITKSNSYNIDIFSFYQSLMINMEKFNLKYNIEQMIIPNPFKIKGFIIRNILESTFFKDERIKFMVQFEKNNKATHTYIAFYNDNLKKDETEYKFIDEDLINEDIDNKYIKTFIANNQIKINKIYFNPENCRYIFIEMFRGKYKKVIWVVPLFATSGRYIDENRNPEFEELCNSYPSITKLLYDELPKYLSNFKDFRKNHIGMLLEIKKIYDLNKYNISCSLQSHGSIYNCLHFHLLDKNSYENKLSVNNKGSRLIAQLFLEKIINYLQFNDKYYQNFNIPIFLLCM